MVIIKPKPFFKNDEMTKQKSNQQNQTNPAIVKPKRANKPNQKKKRECSIEKKIFCPMEAPVDESDDDDEFLP